VKGVLADGSPPLAAPPHKQLHVRIWQRKPVQPREVLGLQHFHVQDPLGDLQGTPPHLIKA